MTVVSVIRATVRRKRSVLTHLRRLSRSCLTRCVIMVTITDFSPDSITEIPQVLIGVVGLFGV
jgi:hypothetical protein